MSLFSVLLMLEKAFECFDVFFHVTRNKKEKKKDSLQFQ